MDGADGHISDIKNWCKSDMEYKICPECGIEIDASLEYCPYCGCALMMFDGAGIDILGNLW